MPLFNFHIYRNNRVLPDDYYRSVTQMLRKGCTAVIIRRQKCRAFLGIIPRVARKTRRNERLSIIIPFAEKRKLQTSRLRSLKRRVYRTISLRYRRIHSRANTSFDDADTSGNSAIVISVKVDSSFNRGSTTRFAFKKSILY